MRELILKALISKYESELQVLAVNMENYFSNAVGVAEHPDIIGEIDKLMEQISAAEEKLRIVNDILGEE
jgi:hypothetical protein